MTDRRDDVHEITPYELVRAIERGDALQVVDVRRPDRVQQGRIDLLPDGRFHNVLGSALRARTDLGGTGIVPGLPIVTVCGKGHDSRVVAAHLASLGLEARSLEGGMAAYMETLIERPLAPPAGCDRLVQFDRIGKGALAYLIVSDGEALIVDPPRESSALLAAARAAGARIVGVADTHVHADYVSGGPALGRELSVPYHLHPADAVYPYDGTPGRLTFAPLADGDTLRVGRASVLACHTPGHTEGSISFRIGDDAILTGDFVFVESIGRPDLAGRATEWAGSLWGSLGRARREWPGGARVLPAHYASDRERRPDRSVAGAWSELLRTNAALGLRDRAAFLEWATAAAAVPEAYRTIKAINVGLTPVTPQEAIELEVGRNECALRG